MGGQTRQFCLLKELVRLHQIDYIGSDLGRAQSELLLDLFHHCTFPPQKSFFGRVGSFISKRQDKGYPQFVQQLEPLRKQLEPAIERAVSSGKYDLIHVEHSNIAHWVHGIEASIPKILVAQNVKTEMWKRYADNAKGWRKKRLQRNYLRFRDYESRFLLKYNRLVAVSEVDKGFISNLCPNVPVSVVANGVDVNYFRSRCEQPQRDTLVFTGSMAHPPNNEAALHFCQNIFPKILAARPNVRLAIVGSHPSRDVKALDNGHNVKVTGFVEDTRPYLDSAAVVIVPLLSGSGTRLKILEAMAMGKGIVSTSIGAEGIEYTAGDNILIADAAETFADRVIELLGDVTCCIDLGRSARILVEQKYSWPILAAQLEKVYFSTLDSRSKDGG